ncbi:MAG: hypothetical protein M1819_005089 [Sarea resinae]|nr:MAG: hypothetical protein M1819_005089 [Sarea resinae]
MSVARLPLALPPQSTTPELYAIGIAHFAHVYQAFETLWLDLVDADDDEDNIAAAERAKGSQSTPLANSNDDGTDTDGEFILPPLCVRMYRILSYIRLSSLSRTSALRKDLAALSTDRTGDLAAQLSTPPTDPRLQEYLAHIRATVADRPHVLVAYAWTMYMAIFAGGRWIRAQLQEAPEGFWPGQVSQRQQQQDPMSGEVNTESLSEPTTTSSYRPGFAFFEFPGPHDGQDIKAEFKYRLISIEGLLTPAERNDIVDEALEIFRYSALLVEELDTKAAAGVLTSHDPASSKWAKWEAVKSRAAAATERGREGISAAGVAGISHQLFASRNVPIAGMALLLALLGWAASSQMSGGGGLGTARGLGRGW